jgi:hypothetical protein
MLGILAVGLSAGQALTARPAPEPTLPVIDENACPFEGCTFRKWVVIRDVELFSTWKEGRQPVAKVSKGQIVTGETGVHVTWEPDRIQVQEPIPKLQVETGDTILRYMYLGEGFANIWAKGRWWKEYDCSFIVEKNGRGCLRGCAAKVVADGRKDWWVRVRTSQGSVGWTKAEDQFDCMDSLGGDDNCEKLNAPAPAVKRGKNEDSSDGRRYVAPL